MINKWLNTDINYQKNAVYLNAGRKFPIQNNTIDFIFSEHIFEHLDFSQALNMLSESYRTLKPGGVLRIATPNMQFLLNLYLQNNTEPNVWYIDWSAKTFLPDIYPLFKGDDVLNIFVINNFFRDWGHQIIHTQNSLTKMMLTVWFKDVREAQIWESSFPELRWLEHHGNSIPPKFNKLETMVIDAVK